MQNFSSTTKGNSLRIWANKRVVLVAVLGGILATGIWILPHVFSIASSVIMTPVVRFEAWLRTSGHTIPSYIRDRSSIIAERDTLTQSLIESQANLSREDSLRTENELLRTLLNEQGGQRIGAAVLGRPTELPYDVLVIDKGWRDGVVANAPVFVGDERVIGMVFEVYETSAVVVLATSPEVVSTVYIYGPNIYTNAVGQGGGIMRVSVPQGIPVAEGNTVVVPSFDAGVYGVVNSVESTATDPEQYGYVSIDVPIASLRFVAVGADPLPEVSYEHAETIVQQLGRELFTVPVPLGVLVDTSTTSLATTTGSTTP